MTVIATRIMKRKGEIGMLLPAYQSYVRTYTDGNILDRPTVTDEKL